jgi:hypothetical protein
VAQAVSVSHEPLPDADLVHFLEMCIERYDKQVEGYSCIMEKRERVDGKLQNREIVEACFREHPYSVFMHWTEGAPRADRVLYVKGENNDKMLARPKGAIARAIAGDVVKRDVDGPEAKRSGRYNLLQFGMKNAMTRTLAAWQAARQHGQLSIEYRGVNELREVGGRPCYTLARAGESATESGVAASTIYIDRDTWLQVGSVLTGKDGQLVGQYFFRDIHINPTFNVEQFKPAALTPGR